MQPHKINMFQLKQLNALYKSFTLGNDKHQFICPTVNLKDVCKLCREINEECTCSQINNPHTYDPCPCSIPSITTRMHKQRLKAWIIFNGGF